MATELPGYWSPYNPTGPTNPTFPRHDDPDNPDHPHDPSQGSAEEIYAQGSGGGGPGVGDNVLDPQEPDTTPPRWRTENPYEWLILDEYIRNHEDLEDLREGERTFLANTVALDWALRNTPGEAILGGFLRWPTAWELYNTPEFQAAATHMAFGFHAFPPFVKIDGVLHENTLYGFQDRSGGGHFRSFMTETERTGPPGGLSPQADREGPHTPIEDDPAFYQAPDIAATDLADLIEAIREARRPSSGSGFRWDIDKRRLRERGREMWRAYLRDDADLQQLESWISTFVGEARAMALRGGTLDFDAFMLERFRTQGRWNVLYGKKPDQLDELEYFGRFDQVADQLAVPERIRNEKVVRAAIQGQSSIGFGERMVRSQEVFDVAGRRNFAQAFAQRAASSVLGAGGRPNTQTRSVP